jgi:hypothetical protein
LKGLFDQFVAGRFPDVTRHGQLRATAAVFEFILSYFSPEHCCSQRRMSAHLTSAEHGYCCIHGRVANEPNGLGTVATKM